VPIAYLTGIKEFWRWRCRGPAGRARAAAETELIVALALHLLPEQQALSSSGHAAPF